MTDNRFTHYHIDTPLQVKNVLNALIEDRRRTRVRIFFGDRETGRAWNEEHDVTGYLGRSTGPRPIPLLINNAHSLGGPGLLDHCILKIIRTSDSKVLYVADNFNLPIYSYTQPSDLPEFGANCYADSELCARFKTPQQAARWCQFMRGERS